MKPAFPLPFGRIAPKKGVTNRPVSGDDPMKMNSTLAKAFNDQLSMEFKSFYSYLQIAAWFETRSLPGFALAWRESVRCGLMTGA